MSEKSPESVPSRSSSGNGKLKSTYVVGIGASAGGLEALVQFFSRMPTDTGLSFVVVQHISPDFKSVMDELLSRHTTMPIHIAESGMIIRPNSIYLIPPKKDMVVNGHCLQLIDRDLSRSISLPIDVFFKSLGEELGNRAIAVVLSGTGSDGSRGIVSVHDAGGLVIAQNEETAKFNGMPRSAVDTGLVNYVVSAENIPELLVQHIGGGIESSVLTNDSEMAGDEPKTQMDQYLALFQKLRTLFKTDFGHYKPSTVNRRIERRIKQHKLKNLSEYLEVLEKDSEEANLLYRDILIGVTKFFRDLEAFAILEKEVVRKLVDEAEQGGQIRVWVPACASGEEAYSIAILFDEQLRKTDKRVEVKIFATDLNGDAITAASNGLYANDHLENLSQDRKLRYFTAEEDAYRVQPDLRRQVVFAEQDLLKDPPFTKMHLVSCRNLLIYFQPSAQRKVLGLFHFALQQHGCLFLGPSETLGDLESEFETISRTWNLFRKRSGAQHYVPMELPEPTPLFQSKESERSRGQKTFLSIGRRRREDVEIIQIYDNLLEEYMPPSLLVGPNLELMQVFGEADQYIKTRRGRASLDILNLVDGSLRLAISTAVNRVEASGAPFSLRDIPLENGDKPKKFVDLAVKPMRDQRYLLIQFTSSEETAEAKNVVKMSPISPFDPDSESMSRIIDLERELQFSRESLQATIEELETTNEELQATNEELLASNEELQSTNEELQSVNEELFTVNTEYEKKNHELVLLNSDIDNLLQSTQIGTIFVDEELCIRKFTPAIAGLFNLLPMDVGRPFEHITFNLVEPDNVVQLAREVIEHKKPITREARDRDNKWYLMRFYPYMKGNQVGSGAVLTLVEVTDIKRTEEALALKSAALENSKKDLEEFAYSASHDMQSPLRTISGYLDLVQKRMSEEADPEILEYLTFAYNGAQRLRHMINGLLDYSRIETRAAEFEEFQLADLRTEVETLLRERIEEESARINWSGENLIAYGEYKFVVRLLKELLENSLKYRGEQDPVISIIATPKDREIEIRVSDNGMGIDAKELPSVCKIFYTGENGRSERGFGIGLAICRRIVSKHSGRLSIESQLGVGTTVVVRLPSRTV